MDVERVLRKLEPVIPKQVARWRTARALGDTSLRDLIDRQVWYEARRIFGDINKEILLSLPPKSRSKGRFDLGTVQYGKPRWPFGLQEGELLQNLAIFGRSGAGKTNVVFHLLKQLTQRRVPWLFLDWKRTARHLLPQLGNKVEIYTPGRSLSPLAFNPFVVPPDVEQNVYISQVVDVLAEAFTLGDGSRSVLQQALSKAYGDNRIAPTIHEVIDIVEDTPGKERVRGWKISALRALAGIAFSQLATTTSKQEEQANGLLKGQTIIELDALSEGAKQFIVPILCLWLYAVRLALPTREKLSLAIVVEEAHHVLYRSTQRSSETVMNRLLRQCRELGMAMIVVDQHPHLISSAALGNTFTTIMLNLKDPADINRAAGLCQLDEKEKHHLSDLPVGHGIVKMQDRWRKSFLVSFPLVSVAKGSVTDAVLRRYVRSETRSDRNRSLDNTNGRIPRILKADSTLDEHSLAFLDDVLTHPDDGVRQRFHRLGISARRGTRTKQRLIDEGLLDSLLVPIGQSRKLVLRLSPTAAKRLGISTNLRNESLAHEYWKATCAERYRRLGFRVELEAPLGDGRVDVLATKGAKRVGIEVETGKSETVKNVKRCLLERLDRIMIVATDGSALEKTKKQLTAAGLLGSGRVTLERASGKLSVASGSRRGKSKQNIIADAMRFTQILD